MNKKLFFLQSSIVIILLLISSLLSFLVELFERVKFVPLSRERVEFDFSRDIVLKREREKVMRVLLRELSFLIDVFHEHFPCRTYVLFLVSQF